MDPEFKGVVIQHAISAFYSNQKNFRNFSYTICRQSVLMSHEVFYFRRNFYLIEEINRKLRIFREMGILNYFILKYTGLRLKFRKQKENGPVPLTTNHFFGIFQLWFIGLTISSIAICGENILHKFRRKTKEKLLRAA